MKVGDTFLDMQKSNRSGVLLGSVGQYIGLSVELKLHPSSLIAVLSSLPFVVLILDHTDWGMVYFEIYSNYEYSSLAEMLRKGLCSIIRLCFDFGFSQSVVSVQFEDAVLHSV